MKQKKTVLLMKNSSINFVHCINENCFSMQGEEKGEHYEDSSFYGRNFF